MKSKIVILILLVLSSYQEPAFCKGSFVVTKAEEMQSILCSLEGEAGAGRVTFSFKPFEGILGNIEYNGLFKSKDGYYAIIHTINLTKLQDFEDGSFVFEGIDESTSGGAVKGYFKNANEFEINGYFAKKFSAVDCIYYRLTPLKSKWAKNVVKDNPKFMF